jgi:hypothetical protein
LKVLDGLIDDFDFCYEELKQKLIKDVLQTSFKRERQALLDGFFGEIERKADVIKGSEAY